MARADQPPSFPFYPADFLASRAVRLMSPEALGGYILLMCYAWLAPESGVLEDDAAELAKLSGLGSRWAACEVSIRRGFRATSREGRKVLVQQRMVLERAAQEKRYQRAAKGASATNKARWGYVAERQTSDRQTVSLSLPLPSSSARASAPKESAARERALLSGDGASSLAHELISGSLAAASPNGLGASPAIEPKPSIRERIELQRQEAINAGILK